MLPVDMTAAKASSWRISMGIIRKLDDDLLFMTNANN